MLSFSHLDADIQATETRLNLERQEFESAISQGVDDLRQTVVSTVTSPKFLISAATTGFLAGRLFLGRRKPSKTTGAQAGKKSLLGVIAAAGFSLLQSQLGGPVGMARWVASNLGSRWAARKARRRTETVPLDSEISP